MFNQIANFYKIVVENIDVLKNCEICDHLNQRFLNNIKYACVYFKNEAYVVNDRDEVFNIINNQTYRVDFLCGKGVYKFDYSYTSVEDTVNYHMLALTTDGRVFGWGENAFEQITGKNIHQIFEPVRLDFSYGYFTMWRSWCAGKLLEISETVIFNSCSGFWKGMGGVLTNRVEFTMIACGQTHCLAVTKDNDIVVWGNNKYGQIGNGKQGEKEEPYKILVKKEHIEDYPSKVQGGKKWCLLFTATITALLITAVAFVNWMIAVILFLIVRAFIKVREAPTYFQEDMFLDEEAAQGRLGIPNLIKDIECGAFHNLVLFENGDVWGWGDNEFGQLGRITTVCHTEPRPIFSNAIAIAAVNNHSLVLCKREQGTFLYTMGDNTYGQLGEFELMQCRVPLRIEKNYNFTDVETVNGISLGVTEKGEIYAWGLYKFEEIKGKKTNYMTKSKMAYIIQEPKLVNCRSINEFITRYSSLTRGTIEISKSQHDEHDEHVTLNEGVLIEESELKIVEYVSRGKADDYLVGNLSRPISSEEPVSAEPEVPVVQYSTHNKYVLFDGCQVTANRDLKVHDVKQTGIKSWFSKKS